MFPFFSYLLLLLLLLLYIYENICVVFLGFGLLIRSHILCALLKKGLRMKYKVPIRT